jgi:hypothetical protein
LNGGQKASDKGNSKPSHVGSHPEVDCATRKCFYELKETTTAQASYDQQTQRLLYDMTLELLKLA